jgi:predicted DNA-binding protein with PD1-like motif
MDEEQEGTVRSQLLGEQNGQKSFAVIFDKGDEAHEGLERFARESGLTASHLTAIGAFSDVVLGYFDRDRTEYQKIPIHEQVEVLSLIGDVALDEGKPKLHAHVVLGRADGTTVGGHLIEGHVWPTLEVMVTELPAHLRRRTDKETGLALIDLRAA